MAFANDFVISCGLVIAEPTTAQNAPSSKTLFNFAGVLIFPSAFTWTGAGGIPHDTQEF